MNRSFFLYLLVVLMLGSCRSLPRGTTRFDESNSPYVKEQSAKVEVKEEAAAPAPKPVAKSEPVTVREEKVKAVDQSGVETIYRYYVIVGSFQVLDNARNFRAQLIQQQFVPVILESEIGFYRVSVAAFNAEADARTKIDQIRNNFDQYRDTWLLIRKD